jgi:RNA polymerase sigma factor for flagellar operon FliA
MGRNSRNSRSAIARSGKQKRDRAAAALYKTSRRLRAVSPVSSPLSYGRPARTSDNGTEAETAAQTARRQAKAQRRRHEDALWQAFFAGHGEEARNALWLYYQPLVRYISERLKAKLPECIDLCDLMGAGNIGLQDAISKFDPAVGVRFETYCVPRIRGAILDSIRALDWVPRMIRNKSNQFERVVQELAAVLQREPTEEEIARRLAIKLDEYRELRKELDVKAQISVEGCNQHFANDRDIMRIEMLEEPDEFRPTRNLEREEIRAMALRGLSHKERAVVEEYYFRGRSMKEIGDRLRLSESRICQIHSSVLEVLRKKFRAYQESCVVG